MVRSSKLSCLSAPLTPDIQLIWISGREAGGSSGQLRTFPQSAYTGGAVRTEGEKSQNSVMRRRRKLQDEAQHKPVFEKHVHLLLKVHSYLVGTKLSITLLLEVTMEPTNVNGFSFLKEKHASLLCKVMGWRQKEELM